DRFVHDLRGHGVGSGVDDAAGVVRSELAEVVEAVRDIVHVDLRFDEALAGVQGLGTREFVLALTEGGGELQQQIAAFAGRHGGPDTGIEGPAGGGDRQFGVGRAGLVHLGDEAAVGGVVDLPGSTVDGRNPLTVDEECVGHDISYSLLVNDCAICVQRLPATRFGRLLQVSSVRGSPVCLCLPGRASFRATQ